VTTTAAPAQTVAQNASAAAKPVVTATPEAPAQTVAQRAHVAPKPLATPSAPKAAAETTHQGPQTQASAGTATQARNAATAPVVTSAPVKPAQAPPVRPKSTKPVQDPLQPKLAMTTPKRTTARGRVFGAPISSGHATAGIDTRPYVPKPARTAKTPANVLVDTNWTNATAQTLAAASPAPRPAPAYLDPSELEQITTVDPVYPAAAMRNRQEGWVTLEFTVTDGGSVRDPWVTDAEPADVFDAAAIAAVKQWRFKPRVANGRAVEVRSSVTLRFAVDR
jgi:TonB family protein